MHPSNASRVLPGAIAAIAILSQPACADIVKIFVVAGQSNAVGYGADAHQLPPALQAPQADVPFWFEDGLLNVCWVTSGGAMVPLRYQSDPSCGIFGSVTDGFGPEISAGRALADASIGRVAIVKVASDGTSLAVDWQPGGACYPRLTSAVAGARQQLVLLGHTPVVSGFFWLQGETDAMNLAWVGVYGQNLAAFIQRVRQDLQVPALPFVIARTNINTAMCNPFGCFPYLPELRAAQSQVAQTVPRVTLLNTDDLPLQSDGAHFTVASQVTLGQRLAGAYLTLTCYPNCDGSTVPPILNVNDFGCFLNAFASGGPYANCDASTSPPVLNVNDFSCFLNQYAAGCPYALAAWRQ